MTFVTIDLGSYSVKMLSTTLEKKTLIHSDLAEKVIPHIPEQKDQQQLIYTEQFKLLSQLYSQIPTGSKVKIILPRQYVTTRLLKLPTSNKKQALQMIPFQLEDDVPYGAGGTHFAAQLIREHDFFHALLAVISVNDIELIVQKTDELPLLTDIATTDFSLFQCFLTNHQIKNPVLFIDLGHYSVKAHFAYQGLIQSTQISFVAGSQINHNIASSYAITLDQAIQFKHDNAFLLTADQYQNADKDQKVFAQLMHQMFVPLLTDLKRWMVGFRVDHQVSVERIFLLGGGANIKNITQYFSYELGVSCELFSPYLTEQEKSIFNPFELQSFALAHLLPQSHLFKNPPLNLRSGKFSATSQLDLPLHSYAFSSLRIMVIFIISYLIILTHRFSLNSEINKQVSQITNQLKNSPIENSVRNRLKLKNNPKEFLKDVDNIYLPLGQELNALQAILSIDFFGNSKMILDEVSQVQGANLAQIQWSKSTQKFKIEFKDEEAASTFSDKVQTKVSSPVQKLGNRILEIEIIP